MSWWKTGERREIVDYPDGRNWRCPNVIAQPEGEQACGFSEPEDARPNDVRCPDCGTQLVRTAVRL